MAKEIHFLLQEVLMDDQGSNPFFDSEKYDKLGIPYDEYSNCLPKLDALQCLIKLSKQFILVLYFSDNPETCKNQISWFEKYAAKYLEAKVKTINDFNQSCSGFLLRNRLNNIELIGGAFIHEVVMDESKGWKGVLEEINKITPIQKDIYSEIKHDLGIELKHSESQHTDYTQMTDEERYLNSRK